MANNANGLAYPLTKMNFVVSLDNGPAGAAFSEVTGIQGEVKVIEFRQGNSGSLAPVKIPGLVAHSNVTLKFGYTINNDMKQWIMDCLSERRDVLVRKKVQIELIDISTQKAPQAPVTSVSGTHVWVLSNAFVAKYSGPDLNANDSQVAIESIELAYEELVIPN